MVLAPLVIRGVVHWRATKERELFGEQLADHLAVVGGSLRVGHSLPAALARRSTRRLIRHAASSNES